MVIRDFCVCMIKHVSKLIFLLNTITLQLSQKKTKTVAVSLQYKKMKMMNLKVRKTLSVCYIIP